MQVQHREGGPELTAILWDDNLDEFAPHFFRVSKTLMGSLVINHYGIDYLIDKGRVVFTGERPVDMSEAKFNSRYRKTAGEYARQLSEATDDILLLKMLIEEMKDDYC